MLKEKINDLLSKQNKITIAIDGRCGAGKSTLAAALAKEFCCNIIHMDDFFLPAELRTPERLAEPGGNVHYERFLTEVVPPLLLNRCGSYRIYSCRTNSYSHMGYLENCPLTIIEGAYCMRPEFRRLYDLSIFLDVSPQMQKERLLHRVGTKAFVNFTEKWIPMEEAYFSFYHIPDACDLILTSETAEL